MAISQWLRLRALGRNLCRDLMRRLRYIERSRTTLVSRVTKQKKLKNEVELFKAALEAGMKYGEDRGVVEFEPTDSASDKALYVYRLLVHDKIIAPLPEEQVSQKSVRHRLAMWHARQLPKDDPLLN